ncbi:hypothetical protein LINPERPRIM_LOCUS38417 [Linum perenne]
MWLSFARRSLIATCYLQLHPYFFWFGKGNGSPFLPALNWCCSSLTYLRWKHFVFSASSIPLSQFPFSFVVSFFIGRPEGNNQVSKARGQFRFARRILSMPIIKLIISFWLSFLVSS